MIWTLSGAGVPRVGSAGFLRVGFSDAGGFSASLETGFVSGGTGFVPAAFGFSRRFISASARSSNAAACASGRFFRIARISWSTAPDVPRADASHFFDFPSQRASRRFSRTQPHCRSRAESNQTGGGGPRFPHRSPASGRRRKAS